MVVNYMPTSVKLIFCLPYFDYCMSLCLYYSKVLLTKLCKCYYFCLFELFRFNFVNMSIESINKYFFKYGLYAFQCRIFMKISLSVPQFLKEELELEERK